MSTVEATSGTTTTHPHHPSSAVRDRALALGVLAVLAGIGAIVTAVWDWARDGDIPNTLPTMLGIIAGVAGICALVLHVSQTRAAHYEAVLAEIHHLGERLGAPSPGDLPPGAATRIYRLGYEAGEQGRMS